MPDDTPGRVAATLAGIQDQLDDLDAIRLRRHSMAEESVNLKLHAITEDFCRLLAAVEAALKLHAPEQETVYRACAEHVLTKTLHDRERFSKMATCPDCVTVPHRVCAHCECPNDEWPCPTYWAITAALTGEEAGDGG